MSSAKLNTAEIFTVIFGGVLGLAIWIHFVIICLCETNSDASVCSYYINSNKDGNVKNWLFFAVLGFIYITYMVIAIAFMPTKKYLSNVAEVSGREYVKQLYNAKPYCFYKIHCYHTLDDKDKRIRVTTHMASVDFKYSSFSSHVVADFPERASAMRLRLTKQLEFSDAYTSSAYTAQYNYFINKNTVDTNQDKSTGIEIPGYKNYVLAFDRRPFGFSLSVYVVCSMLTFNVLYSFYILYVTKPVDVIITKEVILDPPAVDPMLPAIPAISMPHVFPMPLIPPATKEGACQL